MTRPQLSLTLIREIIGNAPFLFEGSFPDGIAYASRLGYDCVEIHTTEPDELADPAIPDALKTHHLHIGALGTGRLYVNAGLSLTSSDPGNRAEAIRRMKEYIDYAKIFHAIVIIGCVRGNVPEPKQKEAVLDLLGDSMKELDKYAAIQEATMVFEPINRYENNYLCNTYEIADFLRANKLQNIKMMIDTFHMNIEEPDMFQSISDNGSYIKYAHFADSNRWYPGNGHLDFPKIIKTLLGHHYQGIISAECLPLPDKDRAARGWLDAMKELLSENGQIE